MIDVEKLNALVDNELEPAERAEVETMLAQDATSAAELTSIRALKTALQDHVRPVPCEDEWKGCIKRLNEIDGTKKTRAIVDRWAWAMCSCLFVFIVGVGLYNRVNPNFHAGTGDLTRAGMEKPIRDVYHWVKNQFGMSATATPEQQLQVVGGWQGTYGSYPVANLHLQDKQGDLSLVIVRGNVPVEGVSPMDDNQHYTGKTGDANSVVWSESGCVLILTGKREASELRDVSTAIHINPQP